MGETVLTHRQHSSAREKEYISHDREPTAAQVGVSAINHTQGATDAPLRTDSHFMGGVGRGVID